MSTAAIDWSRWLVRVGSPRRMGNRDRLYGRQERRDDPLPGFPGVEGLGERLPGGSASPSESIEQPIAIPETQRPVIEIGELEDAVDVGLHLHGNDGKS